MTSVYAKCRSSRRKRANDHTTEAHHRHRRSGLRRLPLVRPPARARRRGALRRQFLHGREAERGAHSPASEIRAHSPRRDVPALSRSRRDFPSGVPGGADPLPAGSGSDAQDLRAWRDQHSRPRQAPQGARAAGVHVRGLRRSPRASPDRRLLGQRQSDRHPLLLRRRQARGGDAVLRLPPPARPPDQDRAHLQYLRAAHACERRPRRLQLHRAGAAWASRSRSTATACRRARSAM